MKKLEQIKECLLKVGVDVYHYKAHKKTEKYIVWAEDGEGSSASGDNKKQEQSITGTVDYFTTEENDEKVEEIQSRLSEACISFYLNSVQYEDETSLIHYEWVWEIT